MAVGSGEQPAQAIFLLPPEIVYGKHDPTYTYIPWLCRPTYNRLKGNLFATTAEKKGEEEWLLLTMFNKVILPPACNRRDDTKSAACVTQSKLDQWEKGRYMDLWEEAIKDTKLVEIGKKKRKPRKGNERTQEQFNADRTKTLAAMGQYLRANQDLMSQGMEQTRENLRNKHPQTQGPLEHEPREEDMEAAEVSSESVLKALKRL